MFGHMKYIEFILSLFVRRRNFTLGPQVFQSKSWLEKQVEEAQFQQAKKTVFGIDWSPPKLHTSAAWKHSAFISAAT